MLLITRSGKPKCFNSLVSWLSNVCRQRTVLGKVNGLAKKRGDEPTCYGLVKAVTLLRNRCSAQLPLKHVCLFICEFKVKALLIRCRCCRPIQSNDNDIVGIDMNWSRMLNVYCCFETWRFLVLTHLRGKLQAAKLVQQARLAQTALNNSQYCCTRCYVLWPRPYY